MAASTSIPIGGDRRALPKALPYFGFKPCSGVGGSDLYWMYLS